MNGALRAPDGILHVHCLIKMALHSDLLKEGIIQRLQEYDAYIDDELPDYIMVMIANKKTVSQISTDLQLFLGENTEHFSTWLKDVLENPDLLLPTRQSTPGTPLGSTPSPARPESESPRRQSAKRPRSPDHHMTQHDRPASPPVSQAKVSKKMEDSPVKDTSKRGVQKIRLPRDPQEKKRRTDTTNQPWRTKDQDLRSLIRRRKAETTSDGENDDERASVGVSSVVQLPAKQERPRRSGGTSRLLRKAISDIHGVSSTDHSSSSSRQERKRDSERKQKKVEEPTQSSPPEVLGLQEPGFVDEFREEEEERVNQSSKQATPPATTKTPPSATPPPAAEAEEEETGVKKKKKSIKDRLQPLPEDDKLDLTEVEVATLAAVRKVLPPGQVDLRHFLKNRKEKNPEEEKPQGPTRFVVTLNNSTSSDQLQRVSSSSKELDQLDEEEVSGSKGLLERCKFWPSCKNGDSCPYHHPTVPCRLFPNCKYGQKCCFVHPLCKYDGRCTKPGCHYLHTVPKSLTPPIQPKVLTLPLAAPFAPITSVPQFSYGGDVPRSRSRARFPNKSALTWTPGKSTSERQFAVPDSQATNMQT